MDGEVRRAPLGGAQQFEWWKLLTGACNAITVRHRPGAPVPYPRVVAALAGLLARHEALRTTFRLTGSGIPVQVVHPPAAPRIRCCDEETPAAREEFHRSLTDPPFTAGDRELVRLGVVRSAGSVVEVLLVVSHAVFDGYSERIVLAELAAACRPDPEPARAPDPDPEPAREPDPEPAREPDPAGGPGPADGSAPGLLAAVAQGSPQPVDSALAEQTGELRPGREAAERFWREEIRRIPDRLITPLRPGVFQRYGAGYRSTALPPALVLAARRHRTSPAVVYSALVHALLAIMSRAPVTVLRNHFAGRTLAEERVVGCYHCILPTTLDLTDRPRLGALIERLRVRTFRVQSRYRIGQLTLREIQAAEERRRGVPLAVGTTLNFDHGPELTALQGLPDRELTDLLARSGEPELGMGRNETRPDPEGFDSYLMSGVESGAMWILASFNSMVFDPGQMRALLTAPERILRAHLTGPDLTLDEWAARLGTDLTDPARPDLDPTEEADLARHPDRVGSPGPEVPQFPPRPGLVDLPRPAGAGAPTDLVREAGSDGAALADLVEVVGRLHRRAEVQPEQCYLESGGRLLRVPAVLARLTEAGWTGLVPEDLTRPEPLTRLAGRLRRTG